MSIHRRGRLTRGQVAALPIPPKPFDLPVDEIVQAFEEGATYNELGRHYGVSANTIRRRLDERGVDRKPYRWTSEHRENYRAARLGTTHTPESRAKMSASHRGVPLSDSHRASLAAATRRRIRLPLSSEQRRRVRDGIQREKEFMQAVLDLARRLGWMAYHTWNSVHSEPGFPDIVAIRGERLVVIECKRGRGRVTDDQERWLRAFDGVCAHVEAYVARSTDGVEFDEIERVLR